MAFQPMMYQAHYLATELQAQHMFLCFIKITYHNHFSQSACLCSVLCSSVVPFEGQVQPSKWILLYSQQYNQHKTHLDGGKHKVHGCTLAWSQTSGFFSNYMLLEEITEQFEY